MKPRYDIKKIKKKNPLQYLLNCKIKTKKKKCRYNIVGFSYIWHQGDN